MPHYIVKLVDEKESKDYYMIWSTIVDAPITYGMELEKFKEWYLKRYEYGGKNSKQELEERLARVEKKGTSAFTYDNADDLIGFNRAGKEESELTKEEIIERFCREKEEDD